MEREAALMPPLVSATLWEEEKPHVIDKLERSTRRYEELQGLISDPEVIRDQKRYRELRQEHAALTDLVEEYGRLKALEEDIRQGEEV